MNAQSTKSFGTGSRGPKAGRVQRPPNPRLQRTRLRSPLSRKSFGDSPERWQ